ncbi:TPA: hypothetical protein ACH3X1_004179 [Trebouxia sp. C0004]
MSWCLAIATSMASASTMESYTSTQAQQVSRHTAEYDQGLSSRTPCTKLVCNSLYVSLQPLLAGPARFKLPRTVAILRLPDKAETEILSCDLVSFITLDSKAPCRQAGKGAGKSSKRAALYRCNLVQRPRRSSACRRKM